MKNRIAAASSTAAAVSAQRPGARGSRTAGHASDTTSHTTRIIPAVRALYAMFSATASCAGCSGRASRKLSSPSRIQPSRYQESHAMVSWFTSIRAKK